MREGHLKLVECMKGNSQLRYYKVSGIEHKVYDPEDQIENGLVVIDDWRYSRIGDWVKADDDCIMQVLRKGKMVRKFGRNKV